MDGARLVALHKNRYWNAGDGDLLDAGAFVAALEYASGREAVLVGKPNPAFFHAAAIELGVPRERIVVVGDDLESDIQGARAAGCRAVAVRTGKLGKSGTLGKPGAETGIDLGALPENLAPDAVLDSIADLPRWLGIAAIDSDRQPMTR
jgi:ribonucleotide monophosphatase NagD (HAD superfamily)